MISRSPPARFHVFLATVFAAIVLALPTLAVGQVPSRRYNEHYHLIGDLQLNIHGLALSNDIGSKYMSWLIEEGGHLGLLGYVWRPRFMSIGVYGQAFGLHQVVDEGVDNGYRLGYGARTTLLPLSIFPLTFYAERHTTTMVSGVLPGREYFGETIGLDWVVAVPKKPRFYLSLYDTRYGVQSESGVPSELTGTYRGQDLDGETRVARSTVIDNDKDSQVRAQYSIEERSSRHRYIDVYADPTDEDSPEDAFTESKYELLLQTFDLDGHTRVTEKTNLDFYTGGHILSMKDGADNKSFNFQSIARYNPNPAFSGTASYSFHADSTGDSKTNALDTRGNVRLLPYFGLLGGVSGRHTSYGEGSIYRRIATETLSFGPWLGGKTGPIETHVQEVGTAGSTQVDPGESGVLLAHSFSLFSSWLVNQANTLSLDGGITNQIERASVGIDQDTYRIGTRWISGLTRRTSLGSNASVEYSRTLNRRILEEEDEEWEIPDAPDQPTGEDLIGATEEEEIFRDILYRSERRTEFQTEVNASTWFDVWINSSIGVGYRLSDSNRALSLGHSFYASGTTNYRPIPSERLRLSGTVTWLFLSLNEQYRNILRARVGVDWMFRKIILGAFYEFELEDRIGQRVARHLVIFKASRSFDVTLF